LIFNTANIQYQAYPMDGTIPLQDSRYLLYYARDSPIEKPRKSLPETKIDGPASELGLDTLLLQKQEVIDAKVRMILSEIYQRRLMKESNLYRINLDQCSFRNLTFAVGEHLWDKRRLDLERRIIDLEEEKRAEETNYFKDLLFLRKELRESLIERMEEEQKTSVLMSTVDESI